MMTQCSARARCGGVDSVRFRVCAMVPRRRNAAVAGLVRGVYRSGDCEGGGSCGSGVVGSRGGVVQSLFRVLVEVLDGNLLAF